MTIRVEGTGPKTAKIAFFGEALGRQEELRGEPFVGTAEAGGMFNLLLGNAGIIRSDCYISNVIKERPKDNDIKLFIDLSVDPIVITDAYRAYEQELYEEIAGLSANVLVALGNIPLYALTRIIGGITKRRGSVYSHEGRKVIACLHPSYIKRTKSYLLQHIASMDFQRVKEQGEFPESPCPVRDYILRPSFDDALNYLESCLSVKMVSYDIEVSRTSREMSCISFSTSSKSAISIPFTAGGKDYFSPEQELEVWRAIAKILENKDIIKANQNIYFDANFIYQRTGIATVNVEDTMVAHGVLAPDFKKGLGFLASLYSFEPYYKDEGIYRIKTDLGSDESFWLYNAKDAVVIHDILPAIKSELKKRGNLETYYHQCRTIEPAVYMTTKGFRCNHDGMVNESEQLKVEAAELGEQLSKMTNGHVTNCRSHTQLQAYFYGIKVVPPILKNKKPTCDEKALKKLAGRGYPEARIALEERRKLNRCSKYLDVDIDEDGRLRGEINVVGTVNGRWSISKTLITNCGFPLQTPPRPIRHYMVADEGTMFGDVDLDQGENRIVSYIAPEPTMLAAFEANMDIHALTGALISGLPYEEVIRQHKEGIFAPIGDGLHSWRYWGKKCNHAFNYGEGPVRFATDCEIEVSQGKLLRNRYLNVYPGIRMYHSWIENELNRSSRTLTNPYGRKRTFMDRYSDEMKRQAYNFIPQSTIADKLNRDGINFIYYNQQWFSTIEMLNQMHDSITMQLDTSRPWIKHAEALLRLRDSLARPIAWRALELKIPVGASFGLNLQEASKDNPKGLQEINIRRIGSAVLLSIKLKNLYEQLRCEN